MKKSLLSLLVAVALVLPAVPAFAIFGENVEIVPKIGFMFKPEITAKVNGTRTSNLRDSGFSAGGDIYIDAGKNVFLGAGAVWGSNVNCTGREGHVNVGFTNVYFTAKYKFEVAEELNSPIIVYPLAQFGMGLPGWKKYSLPDNNFEIRPGLYWGVGAGGEFKNIILELMYTCDYGQTSCYDPYNNEKVINFSYTTIRVQVGYKFAI